MHLFVCFIWNFDNCTIVCRYQGGHAEKTFFNICKDYFCGWSVPCTSLVFPISSDPSDRSTQSRATRSNKWRSVISCHFYYCNNQPPLKCIQIETYLPLKELIPAQYHNQFLSWWLNSLQTIKCEIRCSITEKFNRVKVLIFWPGLSFSGMIYSINTYSVDWFNPEYLCNLWSDSCGVLDDELCKMT